VTVPEAATDVPMDAPAASAALAAEQVAGELREAYLAVAAAAVLLDRTREPSGTPAAVSPTAKHLVRSLVANSGVAGKPIGCRHRSTSHDPQLLTGAFDWPIHR